MNITIKEILQKSMLLDNYKQPLYLFEEKVFEENCNNFINCLKKYFNNNYILSYSYKTNSETEILTKAKELGLYAEIVSDDELEVATNVIGNEKNKIIYNGVIPDLEGKFNVALNEGIVNIDNFREFKELSEKARKTKTKIQVGIRINVSTETKVSRFGIEVFSDDWYRILEEESNNKYIQIIGVHCHSKGGRTLKNWRNKVRTVAKVAKMLNASYIDLGSDMYGPMDERLAVQFGNSLPTFNEYLELIYWELIKVFGDEIPTIIFELGTPLIGNAVSMLSKVVDTRYIKGKKIATLDCSTFDLGFILKTKEVPIDIIKNNTNNTMEETYVYGYTCAEGDLITYRNINLDPGDYIVVRNIGAYSKCLANNFIKKPFKLIKI